MSEIETGATPELIETATPAEVLVEQTTNTEVVFVDDTVEVLESVKTEVVTEPQEITEILEVATQGPPGRDAGVYFEKLLGAVTAVLIPGSEHLLPYVHTATLFTPGGDEVSISINVTNRDVTVSSNVSLANHRLVIY